MYCIQKTILQEMRVYRTSVPDYMHSSLEDGLLVFFENSYLFPNVKQPITRSTQSVKQRKNFRQWFIIKTIYLFQQFIVVFVYQYCWRSNIAIRKVMWFYCRMKPCNDHLRKTLIFSELPVTIVRSVLIVVFFPIIAMPLKSQRLVYRAIKLVYDMRTTW